LPDAVVQNLQDHPRVCGEKAHRKSTPNASGGSPPRVRGKVLPGGL